MNSHEQFRKLRSRILASQNMLERVRFLRNVGLGKDLIVTGCSPGLNNIDRGKLFSLANDTNAICLSVKQSLGWWIFGGKYPDIHVDSNYSKQRSVCCCMDTPICVHLLHSDQQPPPSAIVDITLVVSDPKSRPYASVCISNTKQFDYWMLEYTLTRQFGPTIVPTVVFYLAVHMGVSRILTAGVDFTGIGHYDFSPAKNSAGLHGSLEEQGWFINAATDWRDWMISKGVQWFRLTDVPCETNLPMIPEIKL